MYGRVAAGALPHSMLFLRRGLDIHNRGYSLQILLILYVRAELDRSTSSATNVYGLAAGKQYSMNAAITQLVHLR